MWQSTEHDSEIELEIEDESPAAVFTEAAVALGDLLTEQRGGESLSHDVSLNATDLSTLLDAWLNELCRLAKSDRFVPERVTRLQLAESSLEATVAGQIFEHEDRIHSVIAELWTDDEGVWRARARLR